MAGQPASPRVRGLIKDRSGFIASGGTAQVLAPHNANREYLLIQNLHASANLWVNFGATAVADQPSIQIAAGAVLTFEDSFVPIEKVSILGGTTNQKFTAKEA